MLFVTKAGESSNGRTTDFGSVYLGSSPNSPALSANHRKEVLVLVTIGADF